VDDLEGQPAFEKRRLGEGLLALEEGVAGLLVGGN